MKAVNLIPDEQRRGAGGSSGRSGGVAYAIVGVLAGLVAIVAMYTLSSNDVASRKSQLAATEAQVVASQHTNDQLQAYTSFAALSQSRTDTIKAIVSTRFDWAHALREIPRVLPKDVWFETMAGTVSPTTSAGGGGVGLPGEPAIEVTACTTSQDEVARVITALQRIDGVDQVNLTKSEKSDSANTSAGSCTVKTSYPAFDITVSFKLPTDPAVAPTATTPAANSPASALGTEAPAASTGTPASTAAPVANTTPAAAPTSSSTGSAQG
jgi:Tfp pilus assembly protein PilN